MKINLKITFLGIFSAIEILGFLGFAAVLFYGITQASELVTSGNILYHPLSVSAASLVVIGAFGFFISNPEQDRLDKKEVEAWRLARKIALAKHWKDKEEEEKTRKLKFAQMQTAT